MRSGVSDDAFAALEDELLRILVCPIDKRGLLYLPDEALLYNPRLRRVYRIERGIPMMLAQRAVPAPDDEHRRMLHRARHGEAVGTADQTAERIADADGDRPG